MMQPGVTWAKARRVGSNLAGGGGGRGSAPGVGEPPGATHSFLFGAVGSGAAAVTTASGRAVKADERVTPPRARSFQSIWCPQCTTVWLTLFTSPLSTSHPRMHPTSVPG